MPRAKTTDRPAPASAAVEATEVRAFKMHPKLLYDVIQRQAGTLAKAILEGIMNAVDAGAAECRITLTESTLSITDNGRGFRSREEITTFFEVFGQPHEAAEGKIYGTFRMGRGQLFAFGRNRWTTGTYRMDVDIKHRGLDYVLGTGPDQPGCAIEVALDTPLLPSDLAETERLLAEWARYAPVPIVFNEVVISRDPAKESWDEVLPEAYIRLKETGSLEVYNLGIHTLTLPSYRYGTGGTVVSRAQLKVNFARNDIQADCPVWKQVARIVDQKATDRNTRATTLDDAARRRLADQFRRQQLPYAEFARLRLFTAVNGRQHSFEVLAGHYGLPLTVCPRGHRLGDKLHQARTAFVLADETLVRFGFEPEQAGAFVNWLNELLATHRRWSTNPFKYVPFAELSAGFSATHELLDAKQYTPNERAWVRLLTSAAYQLGTEDAPWKRARQRPRRIVVGSSDTALGWTDGRTYVALARSFLARQPLTLAGFTAAGLLLLHELCHDGPDTAEHVHGVEFYELFHTHADTLERFLPYCLAQLPALLRHEGRALNRAQLKDQDRAVKAERAVAAFAAQQPA